MSTGGGSAGAAREAERCARRRVCGCSTRTRRITASRRRSRRCQLRPRLHHGPRLRRAALRDRRLDAAFARYQVCGLGLGPSLSNSYFYRHTYDVEDSSYGTQQNSYSNYGFTSSCRPATVPVDRRPASRPAERGAALLLGSGQQRERHGGRLPFQHAHALHHSPDQLHRDHQPHRLRVQPDAAAVHTGVLAMPRPRRARSGPRPIRAPRRTSRSSARSTRSSRRGGH